MFFMGTMYFNEVESWTPAPTTRLWCIYILLILNEILRYRRSKSAGAVWVCNELKKDNRYIFKFD